METEERVCKLEDKIIETNQSSEQREKIFKNKLAESQELVRQYQKV